MSDTKTVTAQVNNEAAGGTATATMAEAPEKALAIQTPKAIQTQVSITSPCGEMEVGDYSEDICCTDIANGKRLARYCGNDLCYVRETKSWFVWDYQKWAEDSGGVEVTRKAKAIVETIFLEAAEYDSKKAEEVRWWGRQSGQTGRIAAMVDLAKSEGTIAKHNTEFDADAHLFNCANGVINLKTGELLPHKREYLMTQISPVSYNPAAQCPVWLAHLDTVQRGDAEMIDFLQRSAGYSMVGSSAEESVNFLWGKGLNGKGKTLKILSSILGDYATTVSFDTFLDGVKRSAGAASEDIVRLDKKRMVIAQESRANGKFNEALLKDLTGRDNKTARDLYKSSIVFEPQFTLWLASNYKPTITDQSDGNKRRMKVIPFTVHIPDDKVDRELPDTLWAEREGILAWCVRGAVAWNTDGLKHPEVVKEATREYFAEQDNLGLWIAECCEVGNYESPSSDAYTSFKEFAKHNGYDAWDNKQFKNRLVEAGYKSKHTKKGNVWQGFQVIPKAESDGESKDGKQSDGEPDGVAKRGLAVMEKLVDAMEPETKYTFQQIHQLAYQCNPATMRGLLDKYNARDFLRADGKGGLEHFTFYVSLEGKATEETYRIQKPHGKLSGVAVNSKRSMPAKPEPIKPAPSPAEPKLVESAPVPAEPVGHSIVNPAPAAPIPVKPEHCVTTTVERWKKISVRKPYSGWFIRTHPSEEFQGVYPVVVDPRTNERYIISSELETPVCLMDYIHMEILITSINKNGVGFLWHFEEHNGGWTESAKGIARKAAKEWVQVKANKSRGKYFTKPLPALISSGEPQWPTNMTFDEMVVMAFKDRIIDSLDHPLVKRLEGQLELPA